MNKAKLIDHTLLKPQARERDIHRITDEAKQYGFHSVCINPCWVPLAAKDLAGTDVAVCTVIGFPLGATSTTAKALEAKKAVEDGATEVDMVLNIGHAIDGRWDLVEEDIRSVVKAVNPNAPETKNIIVKVILETCLLNDEQIIAACKATVAADADFVKTSTGFSTGGATVHDVELMRKTVGPDFGVKASGGIHTPADFDAMVTAGANRIGASAGVALLS